MTTEKPVIIRKISSQPVQNKRFEFDVNSLPVSQNSSLQEYRKSAWQTFESIPMPHDKDEAWRRTSLAGFQPASYHLNGHTVQGTPVPESITRPLAGDEQDGQVVIQPGSASVTLKEEYVKAGVVFGSLAEALMKHPHLAEKLGTIVPPSDGKFAALGSAMSEQGIVLYIPAGVRIANPLHSIFWAGGSKIAVFSRVFVWLEDGAEATYVHEFASSDTVDEDIFHNGLVEIHAGSGSHLKFVELQSWGKGVWNITHERADVRRDASVEWIFGAIGSKVTKSFTDFDLNEPGGTIKVSGFYFADEKQHFDHDTQQNHNAANTTSDLLYKGAITDHAYSVWQGMIYVAPGAQKTDGYQANRNLLLCKTARADSIPGLEIKADDVRCTHGATVGKIDAEQEFYLQSRGMPPEMAKRLIVEGFFEPVMDRIPFEGVKERFRDAIQLKMNTICS